MKRAQVVKFWKSLDEGTSRKEIIAAFENKRGYGGERTLDRYIRAYDGFRLGVTIDETAKKTGWKPQHVEKIKSWWLREFRVPVASPSKETERGDEELPDPTVKVRQSEDDHAGIDTEAIKFDKRVFLRSDKMMNERDLRNLLLGLELHRSYKLSEYLKLARFGEFMGLEGNQYQALQIKQSLNNLLKDLGELVTFLKLEFVEEAQGNQIKDPEYRLDPAGLRYLKAEEAQASHIAQAQSMLDSLIQAARESYRAYRAGIREVLYI